MNKTALKNFAMNARKELIEKVKAKTFKIGITDESIKKAQIETSDAIYIDGKQLSAIEKKQREKLISRINEIGYNQVIEEVAYTWFNRFTALRFMEVNNYLPTKVRILSSSNSDSSEPDIIKEALTVDLEIDKELVYDLKVNNKTDELFKYLIIKQCNSLNSALPFMFETIDDYKEILFPEGLLANASFLREMTNIGVIPEDDWKQVEIIGWLYQFYISEKKDQVFADLKKNIKISKENIPAATQLFTPNWIVRYLVENSLGRVWLESYPHSEVKSEWKYYLEETDQDAVVKNQLEKNRYQDVNPEDITFLDPCCGSGHILVYAFDVLYEMYLEKGYVSHEIPKLIIEKNLFGLDIDDRAAQLASFAVMMKAREKSRRVFGQDIKINICAIQESNWITDEMIDIIVDGLATQDEKNSQRRLLECLRDTFWDAKDFGSIINIASLNLEVLEQRIEELDKENYDLLKMISSQELMNKLPSILRQTRIIGSKYDVVCTNPPYMGNNGMTLKLISYLKKNYPNTKSDLSTVFMERVLQLCKPSGLISMINIPVWMFLSSYEKLREHLVLNKTIINMLHFGRGVFGSDFGTTAFVISNANIENYKATYRKLFRDKGAVDNIEQKEQWFFEKIGEYFIEKESFKSIPSTPIAYWISDKTLRIFEKGYPLGDIAEPRIGLVTGDTSRFLRLWHEVKFNGIKFNASTSIQAKESKLKWFPYQKGGAYKKWYGNLEYVVNWENDGYEMINDNSIDGRVKSHNYNGEYAFREAITWTKITSAKTGFRYSPEGFLYDDAGPLCTTYNSSDFFPVLGLLCSNVGYYLLSFTNQTLNILPGNIIKIPVVEELKDNSLVIEKIVRENIQLTKADWDSFETSWEFKRHPLLSHEYRLIEDAYLNWSEYTQERFNRLKRNEEELNNLFIAVYDLQGDVEAYVEEDDVTVTKAELVSEIKSFVSYAVGCMFGRFSLDKEGLIHAGGKFDSNEYITFPADKDNVLPVLSGAYFEDDIVSKLFEFVKVTFGEENLATNIDFIAGALGKKDGETAKESIRRYFLNDFFKDHLQTYKKKPIYWLFTSGKQKAFNCLIYMHRYDKSTLSRIRTDYLHELQIRMDAEKKSLLAVINGDGTAKEISNAKKELKSLDLKIEELRAYDEKLHHMADMQIDFDLDDGVSVNYAKLEGLLAPI